MLKGFKSFLMQGDLIVIAVGLVVALAFSTLIKAFTDSIITPLIAAAAGGGAAGKGLGWTINGQRVDLAAQGCRVKVGGRIAVRAERGAEVDGDVGEVVADDRRGPPVPQDGHRDMAAEAGVGRLVGLRQQGGWPGMPSRARPGGRRRGTATRRPPGP